MRLLPGLRLLPGVLLLVSLHAWAAGAIEQRLIELKTAGRITFDGITLLDNPLLHTLYAAHDFQPVWSTAAAAQLRDVIDAAPEWGLRSADYPLAAESPAAGDERTIARAELMRTAALIRLAAHLHHGKLDPVSYRARDDFAPVEPGFDVRRLLDDALSEPALAALLESLGPRTEIYSQLRAALRNHRAIADAGGWPPIAPGPTLHPGDRSPRVAVLRERLRVSGDLRDASATVEATLFDPALERAVRHFQLRHQLANDGLVGKQTLAALNVPIDDRIDQIRVNLERARWLLHDLPDTHLLVDIAGFEARLIERGRLLLHSRVVVGKPYRRTPVFRSAIESLVLNPVWNVPPTILRYDVLPAIRKNPDYLKKRRMRVMDAEGHTIDPAEVNWKRYTGKTFPYRIRQDSGPDNALGRVKFDFPNPYTVYLHDTPDRDLFSRSERSFSSGCIRMERAQELARLLLQREGWPVETVEQVFADTATRRVKLSNPVPLLLFYWTVAIEEDGDVLFKRDIYHRDAALLAALGS
jgi:L,D-transpeptidase YcbB